MQESGATLASAAELPSPPTASVEGLARLAFEWLAAEQPRLCSIESADIWVPRTCQVLAANLPAGRLETARRFQPAAQPDDVALLAYARQVLVELIAEWDRIAALRRGDTPAWQPVIDRLGRLAYHLLGPCRREEWAAWEARELASRTCADLWRWLQAHSYPFDVPFDRWSATALNNRLREAACTRARHERHYVASLDRPLCDDEAAEAESDTLVDHSLGRWLERTADREVLGQALARLDRRHALVLQLWYLDGWPAGAIADRIGSSVGNVYLLRFRALKKLRGVITRDGSLAALVGPH